MPSPELRHVLPTDVPAVIDTLVEAFTDDPFQQFLFPDPDAPGRADLGVVRRFLTAEVESHMPLGHLYVTGDGDAAALWEPPGVHADGSALEAMIYGEVAPETLEASADQWIEMLASRPDYPHFYLAVLGAADRARGQGLGAALLQRVLTICDAEGIPAHLESSNIRNVSLYQRHGFEVASEIEFTADAVIRPMTRNPGATAR